VEDYVRALADAAAALFMDPLCVKAWDRYCLCLTRYMYLKSDTLS
jgi:hypothetical protein